MASSRTPRMKERKNTGTTHCTATLCHRRAARPARTSILVCSCTACGRTGSRAIRACQQKGHNLKPWARHPQSWHPPSAPAGGRRGLRRLAIALPAARAVLLCARARQLLDEARQPPRRSDVSCPSTQTSSVFLARARVHALFLCEVKHLDVLADVLGHGINARLRSDGLRCHQKHEQPLRRAEPAAGPYAGAVRHGRRCRRSELPLRRWQLLARLLTVLTYLLTCYLTHVAHHYRIYTVP